MADVSERIRNSGLLAWAMKQFARGHIAVYRRTNGRLGAKLLWFPAALVTTTGRRSGTPRTAATLYLRDGAKVVLPASFGGRDEHPLWYLNLKANPAVRVQVRDEHLTMTARDATDEERRRYWPVLIKTYPPYKGYRDAADRVIPLVVCEPAQAP
ncbi:deazaflavin-dependent nitroreductase [Mycobacterium antarcticum]|uniref:nitroreductase family deazaflavin-dependent oxidoreductase n=1 Tax=unclassified Mycolicibacterium TaxID=2636767 RepID=UPI0023A10C9C|nr:MULTISPECIES: nitroreductase family deazaflavin-dependent oxidoreductase [unclassified Mycolicibacterium]BDX30122.1 deazaflavin-dependent nitroreductase [Mycolicibacterium sp. TUM20985]GLP73542.1 deazaflavin-dependent nitroreductase [Mycolicibacterium sp. TUM20983]GLP79258.1 deazaflavin-dependent nitroreductase [Mycolicibacterium sp. TUM20984]